jgi:hypothetical protein
MQNAASQPAAPSGPSASSSEAAAAAAVAPAEPASPKTKTDSGDGVVSYFSYSWFAILMFIAVILFFGAVAISLVALLSDPTSSWRYSNGWGHDIDLHADLNANRVNTLLSTTNTIDVSQTATVNQLVADQAEFVQAPIVPNGVRLPTLVLSQQTAQTFAGPSNPSQPYEGKILLLQQNSLQDPDGLTLSYIPPVAAPASTTDLLANPYSSSPALATGGFVRLRKPGSYAVTWNVRLQGAPVSAPNAVAVLATAPYSSALSNVRAIAQTTASNASHLSLPVMRLIPDATNVTTDTMEAVGTLSGLLHVAADTCLVPLVLRDAVGGGVLTTTGATGLSVVYLGPSA